MDAVVPLRRASSKQWVGADTVEFRELREITVEESPRIPTAFNELDRVLGGGLVPGAVVLLAGDPGIGKSTLLLQSSAGMAQRGFPVCYVSGEESGRQVRLRADRLGIEGEHVFFLNETAVEGILEYLDRLDSSLLVVDSVQTIYSREASSTVGSVTQVRECTRKIMQWAKSNTVPALLAGHVTKDGTVAGPRALEHMVDVVLYLEGDTLGPYRLLRGAKNRFGSTNEVGVFQMAGRGLEEVSEPSLLFLSRHRQEAAGSAVTVTMEGSRPLLAEVQALTTHTVFPQPRRTGTGVDFHRLLLMTAVLSKRLGLPLSDQDVVVNVAGGLTIQEPAADLGIALALVSSFRNVSLDPWTVAIGEVGLGGEVRDVPQQERRLSEATKLGFRRAIVPGSRAAESGAGDLEVIPVRAVSDAIRVAVPPTRSRSPVTPVWE